MLSSERFLRDGQRPLQERLRLLILPLAAVVRRNVAKTSRDRQMLSSERFLRDGQRPLQERLRLLILPLAIIDACEIVKTGHDILILSDSLSKHFRDFLSES